MRIINRDIVAAHIYSSDGKLFLARNTHPAAGVVYGDCWKLPGGGAEQGGTHQQTLIRETQEEVGIDIASFPIELVDDEMTGESEKTVRETGERVLAKMKFFVYKVTINKPALEIPVVLDSQEFDEYKWVSISDLKTVKLSPPSIELFKKLGFL